MQARRPARGTQGKATANDRGTPPEQMTRNLKLLLGASLIFYLIGAINDAAGMYVFAATCVAVVLACFFITRLIIRGVTPSVQLEGSRALAGSEVLAVLSVHNAGAIVRTGMSVLLRVENVTVPGCSSSYEFPLPALPPRSRSEIEVNLACRARGVHRVEDITIAANDPIGVFHRKRRFDEYHNFLGLPRSFADAGVSPWEVLSPEGRRAAQALQRSAGDIRGVRRFDLGDDLRHVHWKVSAHTGELVVKQYRRRRGAEVTIWLDLWESNHPLQGADGPTETAISMAATLVALFVRGEYMVSLAGHGLPADLELPSRGEAYLDRVLVALAQARPEPGLSFCEFCTERARRSPRLASVFAVSPAAEPGLEDTIGSLSSRGAQVTTLLVGGVEADDDAIPRRLWASAHEELAARLRASDAQAVTVVSPDAIPLALGRLAGDASREVAVH